MKKIINKWSIAMAICLVSILSLFTYTKTYAYDLDNNGNLVGNNLLTSDTITFGGNKIGSNNTTDITTTTSWINGNYNINNVYNFTTIDNYSTYFSIDTNNLTLNENYTIVILIDKQINRDNLVLYSSYSNTQVDINATNQLATFGNTQSNVICSRYFTKSSYRYVTIRIMQRNNSNYQDMESNFVILLFKSNYNMNYLINSNQTYYPYSSIEELQQDYNTLLSQYNDLQTAYTNYQSTHSYTNAQYNDLVSDIRTLQDRIDTILLQYDTYVATHSYTDEQYNSLNSQYQALSDNYTTLQNNYNTLEQQYEDALRELRQYRNYATLGSLAYIQNIEIQYYVSGDDLRSEYYTIEQLINNEELITGEIELNRMYENNDIPNSMYGHNLIIHFQDNVVNQYNIGIILNELIPSEVYVEYNEIDEYGFETPRAYALNQAEINQDQIIINRLLLDTNIGTNTRYYITSIEVYNIRTHSDIYDPYISSVATNMQDYNIGYNNGLQSANSEIKTMQQTIATLNNNIEQLTNNYALLQQNYNTLEQQYNTLNVAYNDIVERYNEIDENNNDLYNMVIRM